MLPPMYEEDTITQYRVMTFDLFFSMAYLFLDVFVFEIWGHKFQI